MWKKPLQYDENKKIIPGDVPLSRSAPKVRLYVYDIVLETHMTSRRAEWESLPAFDVTVQV